jgi:hypothetical protein
VQRRGLAAQAKTDTANCERLATLSPARSSVPTAASRPQNRQRHRPTRIPPPRPTTSHAVGGPAVANINEPVTQAVPRFLDVVPPTYTATKILQLTRAKEALRSPSWDTSMISGDALQSIIVAPTCLDFEALRRCEA